MPPFFNLKRRTNQVHPEPDESGVPRSGSPPGKRDSAEEALLQAVSRETHAAAVAHAETKIIPSFESFRTEPLLEGE